MSLLNFAGGVLLVATMLFVINTLVGTLVIERRVRLILVAIIGLWIGTQVSLGSAGALTYLIGGHVPLLGVLVVVPLVAVTIAAIGWSSVRSALLQLPMALILGLNVLRAVPGVFFVILPAEGKMTGPFPGSAGWGDIISGVIALLLLLRLVQRRAVSPGSILGWNLVGLADLLLAVTLGTISFNGGGGPIPAALGGEVIAMLPWSLIPTVLVPSYLILHGVVFAQLWAGRRGRVAA